MNLKQLIEAQGAIQALLNQRGLPAVTSLRLARFWRQAKPELDAYESQRLKLADSLGALSEDGRQYHFTAPNADAFNKQVEAMQAEELNLDVRPFDMVDFKHAGLSVNDIFALEAIGLLVVDWDELEETAVPDPSPNGHKEPETA